MKYLLVIIIILSFLKSFSQNNNSEQDLIIDSLKLQLSKTLEDSLRCNLLIKLSKQNNQIGNYKQSIEYANKALVLAEKTNLKKFKGFAFVIIGTTHYYQGDYAKAIDNLTKALKIYEEIGDKKGIASSLNNIGGIYLEQKDYEKALQVYLKSLEIKRQIDDKKGIAMSFQNIANIYFFKEDYVKALDYSNQSLKINEELGNKPGIALSLNNIGDIYFKLGEYNKAETYLNQSLIINEQEGNKQGTASCLKNLANIYFYQKNTVKAQQYGLKAMKIAQEIGAVIETRDVAKLLAEIYKKNQHYQEALNMSELYFTMRDSILSEENQKEIIRQEYQYNYEKKASQDSIANAKANEIRDAQIAQQKAEIKAKRNQQYALFGGLFLVVVFAGFMYNRFKVTQQQKVLIEQAHQQLEEKNEEILASIRYAKRIQDALMTSQKYIERNINRLKS